MLIALLIILNIPVYLFIGWLAFDTGQGAANSFFESVVELLKILLIPGVVRMALGMEMEKGLSMLQVAGFVIACVGIVWGEYWLIGQIWGG
jgi:hypothetical protein